MTKPKDGGAAFPFQELNDDGSPHISHAGLTVRDWFAGMALQGIIAHPSDGYAGDDYDYCMEFSKSAFEYADAMLAAREKNDE